MTLDDVSAFVLRMREHGAIEVDVSIEEIGPDDHIHQVVVKYGGAPAMNASVAPDPLPDDPDLRAAEIRKREESLDFGSS